jgi:hypothetical protein
LKDNDFSLSGRLSFFRWQVVPHASTASSRPGGSIAPVDPWTIVSTFRQPGDAGRVLANRKPLNPPRAKRSHNHPENFTLANERSAELQLPIVGLAELGAIFAEDCYCSASIDQSAGGTSVSSHGYPL